MSRKARKRAHRRDRRKAAQSGYRREGKTSMRKVGHGNPGHGRPGFVRVRPGDRDRGPLFAGRDDGPIGTPVLAEEFRRLVDLDKREAVQHLAVPVATSGNNMQRSQVGFSKHAPAVSAEAGPILRTRHAALLATLDARGLTLPELTALIDLRIEMGVAAPPMNAFGEVLV